MTARTCLGIIGGSGLYEMEGLTDLKEERIDTPWGEPSDALVRGAMGGVDLVFLPRHGRGHRLSPSHINYRANIDALKRAGVTDVVSISACGSLKEEWGPGKFVLVDQYIDRTFARQSSFFGEGIVAHVSMAQPVCPRLLDILERAALLEEVDYKKGGVYIAIEGPQFSSRAESHLYRAWGCDVIGMTNMPEAKLAREAELPYASVAMVTDYDCWRSDEDEVSVTTVLDVLNRNNSKATRLIRRVAELLGPTRGPSPLDIERTLDQAIITPREAQDPRVLRKLDIILERYRKGAP